MRHARTLVLAAITTGLLAVIAPLGTGTAAARPLCSDHERGIDCTFDSPFPQLECKAFKRAHPELAGVCFRPDSGLLVDSPTGSMFWATEAGHPGVVDLIRQYPDSGDGQ